MNETQEPVITKSDRGTVEKHPAYAMIGASRVSGHARLFGSEFNHQHYVTVSIYAAELHRDLSRDWPLARGKYIEVAMSEAQWASFVCSMNVGHGVQCTLQDKDGNQTPQITGQVKTKTRFKEELSEKLEDVTKSLAKLESQIGELKLSEKAKKELMSTLHMAKMNLAPNLSFVADQFSEHMENTLESAKIEVGAFVQAAITRTGLEALRGKEPIQIGDGKEQK